MDYDVGRILDKIEDKGIRDNTLVVFTSDNGFSCGHHGFWGKGNGTRPLNMYENSIKVPFLASHPGVIPEGSVQPAMASGYDFMPTLLDYLNLPLPEDRNYPGRSFLAALKGEEDPGRDNVVIYDEYGTTRMIRTAEWKYVHRYPDGPNELYDLQNDPDERSNLVDDNAQASRIKTMKTQMETVVCNLFRPRQRRTRLHCQRRRTTPPRRPKMGRRPQTLCVNGERIWTKN